MKKFTPVKLIVFVIIIACIVWAFVYPKDISVAISTGATVFFISLFFGVFDDD